MLHFFGYLAGNFLLILLGLPWLFILSLPFILMISTVIALVLGISSRRKNKLNSQKQVRVLLVDDSPTSLLLIKNLLKSRNCFFKIVDNGLAAVDELCKEKYSLVILDSFMPGLSGFETLNFADKAITKAAEQSQIQKPKHLEATKKIPVIEYSSCQDQSLLGAALDHFNLIGQISKSQPPSALEPQLTNILSGLTS